MTASSVPVKNYIYILTLTPLLLSLSLQSDVNMNEKCLDMINKKKKSSNSSGSSSGGGGGGSSSSGNKKSRPISATTTTSCEYHNRAAESQLSYTILNSIRDIEEVVMLGK